MLKKIDIYIIKKFLTTFFFMLAIIMLLAMVFDISEKLSDFLDKNAPLLKIMTNYYVNFLIYYGNTFSSMIIFISVIWFTAKMAQDSEIIPIMFSGQPFTRFLRPYLISATILMLISLFLNHYLVPLSNKSRLDFEDKYYRDRIAVENFYAEFPGNENVYLDNYTSDEGVVYNLKIEKWNGKKELTSFLFAASAVNKPGTNVWTLKDYYVRRVDNADEKQVEKGNVIADKLTAGKQMDTVLNFRAGDIAVRDNYSETMGYQELKEFIKREKAKGSANVVQHEIELYRRTSYPFATYVLTLIGVAVSSRKSRGGIGASIALGLGFVFIYIFAMKVTTVAAINVGFPSQLAVWIPNLIFLLIGIYLYKLTPK